MNRLQHLKVYIQDIHKGMYIIWSRFDFHSLLLSITNTGHYINKTFHTVNGNTECTWVI